jgi:hypothetical protein
MLLRNAIANMNTDLIWPPGVNITTQFPQTRAELFGMTGTHEFSRLAIIIPDIGYQSAATCKVVAQALGLEPLPQDSTVAGRQQQICDALGCAMSVSNRG